MEYRISPDLSLIMDGGYLIGPDGNFDTPYFGLNLAYVMETFAQDQKEVPLMETDFIQTKNGALGHLTNGILILNVREAL